MEEANGPVRAQRHSAIYGVRMPNVQCAQSPLKGLSPNLRENLCPHHGSDGLYQCVGEENELVTREMLHLTTVVFVKVIVRVGTSVTIPADSTPGFD